MLGALLSACAPRAATSQNSPSLLGSEVWTARAQAFEALRQRTDGLANAAKSGELVGLLERENLVVETALEDPDPKKRGVGLRYGEGYSEYYFALLGACDRHCDKDQPRTLAALANAAYSPTSRFATDLARNHGPQVVEIVLRRARGGSVVSRSEAIAMLGTIAQVSAVLSNVQREAVRSLVIRASDDADVGVRRAAVRTIGTVGRSGDLELLLRISRKDVDPSVRREADAAAARLTKKH